MNFKKFFVEEVETEFNNYPESEEYCEEESVDVELDGVNTDTLIEDIYAQNDLFDKAKSIFKVEELINSLPKEMVTETKKTSVLAILGSFGLTATDVIVDGDKRMDVLSGVLAKIIAESKESIGCKEAEIEEHKKEIARLEKEISDQQIETKKSEEMINTEIVRITNLVQFVGGGAE